MVKYLWYLRCGPGTEKGYYIKPKEMRVKHGLQLIIMWQYQSLSHNKYSILIKDANNAN